MRPLFFVEDTAGDVKDGDADNDDDEDDEDRCNDDDIDDFDEDNDSKSEVNHWKNVIDELQKETRKKKRWTLLRKNRLKRRFVFIFSPSNSCLAWQKVE